MDSFISWVGGKKLLRNKILSLFPEKHEFNRYVEVFGGAGWVLFSSERHAEMEVYNDINGNLVNLFRCTKYHPDALCKELDYTLMSREQFLDSKEWLKIPGLTDIQRAARFFIIIRESFGAGLGSFRACPRDMEKAVNSILEISRRLKSVVIENADFGYIINRYDREGTLFYLDPPYYGTESYYTEKFQEEDHERLKGLLDNIKGKFILSYNDCGYIRELYRDYNITEAGRMHNLAGGVKQNQGTRNFWLKIFRAATG